MRFPLRVALLGGIALGLGGLSPALAQPSSQPGDATRQQAPTANTPAAPLPGGTGAGTTGGASMGTTGGTTPMAREGNAQRSNEGAQRSNIVAANELESGANSFTEGQARARLEEAGFSNLQELQRDNQGFWRARGTHNGSQTEVALDFRGRIAHGNLAQIGQGQASGNNAVNATTGNSADSNTRGTGGNAVSGAAGAVGGAVGNATRSNTPDGTAGNPPSTATGRAVDALQGQRSAPDGTAGNPAGTAAGRAVDNATGANPPAAGQRGEGAAGGGSTGR